MVLHNSDTQATSFEQYWAVLTKFLSAQETSKVRDFSTDKGAEFSL